MILNSKHTAYNLLQNEKGVIRCINLNEELTNELNELGFFVGEELVLKAKAPFNGPVIYEINGIKLGVDKNIASHILIEKS